jgi:hypothetical protein
MKGTRSGIVTVLLLLFGFPLMVDLIMVASVSHGVSYFGLTSFMFFSCIKALPFYFLYLLIKELIRRLINFLRT